MRPWLLVALLAATLPFLQRRLDGYAEAVPAQQAVLYVTSPELVRRLAPGFEALAADVYWLRAVQLFGGAQSNQRMRPHLPLLGPMLELATTLDPRFQKAYLYGSYFLCERPPLGPGQADAGVRLLERGTRQFPRDWIMYQTLGFQTYLYLNQPKRAAEQLLEASRLPGAPFWLEGLAADILRRGNLRETSRRVWRRIHDGATHDQIRENARLNLIRLDALDMIDLLEGQAKAFQAARGRWPANFRELEAFAGRRLPARDPWDVPFDYIAETGTFEIARESRAFSNPSIVGAQLPPRRGKPTTAP